MMLFPVLAQPPSRCRRLLRAVGLIGASLVLTHVALAPPSGPERYEDLLDHADEVVAAIINGKDTTDAARGTFTWVKATVVKGLYGLIPGQEEIIYPIIAARGSDIGVGDMRILFLVKAEPYYRRDHEWSVLSLPGPATTKFHIASSEVRGLTLLDLRDFLYELDKSGAHPARMDYTRP